MINIVKNSMVVTSYGLVIMKDNIKAILMSNDLQDYDRAVMIENYKGNKPIAIRDEEGCIRLISIDEKKYYDDSKIIIQNSIIRKNDMNILDVKEWVFPKPLCEYEIINKYIIIRILLTQYSLLDNIDKIIIEGNLLDKSILRQKLTFISIEKSIIRLFVDQYVTNRDISISNYEWYTKYRIWCIENYSKGKVISYAKFLNYMK